MRTVVVCFDNEDKSHKAPEARHNALVNALYLASYLTVQGFDGRFCQIDARWRDAAGKADFDGVLAQMIHGAG
ncbi:hypothetical protein OEK97_28220, partial [Escherichia coli]|uniref:hypothetical protein n=1 Tax=Escherichia coli TaxID=562 RepID=UPI0021D86615